jgi:thiol-disulfide isomerase/thioredoxin
MDFGFLKKIGIDKPWVLFAILAIVVALIVVYFMYSSRTTPVVIESFGSDKAELMFFYTDWCPHCKTAKPVWESLKTTYETEKIGKKSIVFTEVNCTEDKPEVEALMDEFNVEGYPTFKLVSEGKKYDFDAKPTESSLVSFMKKFL